VVFYFRKRYIMERTETLEDVKARIRSIHYAMQASMKDTETYLELRKELKSLRRQLNRLKYTEMIESEKEGNKHGKF